MKSGASDPFADDESTERQDSSDQSEETEPSDSEVPSKEVDESFNSDEPTEKADSSDGSASSTERFDRSDLPLTLRRDTVKAERDNVHQLFVQDETDREAKDAEHELERMLGDDVYRLDAREAIYLAGIRNLDDAASVLREWGYEL